MADFQYKSEKESEFELQKLLVSNNFNPNYIHYSIFSNEILKELFKKCSKTGNKYGIPDRMYFDIEQNTLIIFECKSDNLDTAIKDIKYYIKNLTKNDYNIYGVAFVNSNLFSIYKLNSSNIKELKDKLINLDTFNLKEIRYNNINMNNEIHKVHNYIRDYTKISNEDKGFFIAIILISIKKSSFEFIFNKFKNKEYIYDIVLDNLNDYNIDINVFNFLRNDENNLHLYNLIKMVFDIYSKNPSIDLLNEFYSEFVKYNNSDGKKLGIVLTPPHIIKLMNEILNINENDIVLDLCTGTGSFLMEANKYNPKMLIGCEYQNKLFALFKCNTILRDIKNIETIKGSCFDKTFKATKSMINPPYGQKNENEFMFILKQLESLEDGGLATAIIPISRLNNNKSNNEWKEKLLLVANIKAIIICRKTLFYPSAGVHCCIIILEKNSHGNNIKTKIINYMNDGFDLIKQNGLVQTDRYEERYAYILEQLENGYCRKIKYNEHWNVIDDLKTLSIDFNKIKLYKSELEYLKNKYLILQNSNIIEYNETNEILITDIFNIEKKKVRFVKNNNKNEGLFNLISATKLNNGIIKNIDYYDYDEHCLTLSDLGEDCSCFYQFTKFSITNHIYVLRHKKNISFDNYLILANIIEQKIKNKYFMFRNINLQILENVKIEIPINLI